MEFQKIILEIPKGNYCRKGKEHCKYFEEDSIVEDEKGNAEPTGYCTMFNEYLETEKKRGIWHSYRSGYCEELENNNV